MRRTIAYEEGVAIDTEMNAVAAEYERLHWALVFGPVGDRSFAGRPIGVPLFVFAEHLCGSYCVGWHEGPAVFKQTHNPINPQGSLR